MNPPRGAVIAVAVSGGVDSAMAALWLKERGATVIGVHLTLPFYGPDDANRVTPDMMAELGRQLDLPISFIDASKHFEREVVSNFVDEYARGRTPNPCVLCNKMIKFGFLWDEITHLGADYLATGHYARTGCGGKSNEWGLYRGIDRGKDQSYFLHRLPYARLSRVVLPLGGVTKEEIRQDAVRRGLRLAASKESQEVCFLPPGGYREFLERRLAPEQRMTGELVDTAGEVLGCHRGLYAYTVGQRHGLGICGPYPRYVVSLQPDRNRVVVGLKDELWADRLEAEDWNWLLPEPPVSSIRSKVRVRYRHEAASALIIPHSSSRVSIIFDQPQRAITPGQAAAAFDDDRVLGGGWISRVD
ncbi:MAG: tRNA 2-thiouridine(34) synthase MnmA [Deltaproteobacteria bacterium]|nr:tRNA 2-thiouridine(34) synthase MnmA [Deltaproteobacteria bacterium]